MIGDSGKDTEAFIANHAQPYDPENDSYERLPYNENVKVGKNDPIYNAHSYHTKIPYRGIIPFIEHYTDPGDVILDPFCGSGMTGVAALLCPSGPRKAIMIDLSPAAIHIARNYCTPCDVKSLKKEFERIKDAVKEEFDWLYETYHEDPKTGKKIPAIIQYTIWSDVYVCKPKTRNTNKHPINPDGCGGEILLWDAAVDKENGKVNDKFKCPDCGETWWKTELTLSHSVPVITNYQYNHPETGKKRRGEHPVTGFELERLQEIDAREVHYWYPTTPFNGYREMWRGVHRDLGIVRACDFFTKRNLRALSRLWKESDHLDPRLRSALKFLLTSAMINISRMIKYRSDRKASSVTGTLYIPSLNIEQNVLGAVTRKLNDVVEALKSGANNNFNCLVTVSSATQMNFPECSIDYIFTDPPFGSNIFYGDCSFLWESWLGEFTDDSKEAVWNKSRKPAQGGKTLEDYGSLMAESFQEMYRVLKPNRWATVVFSNSDDRVWEAIQEAAQQAGFVIYGGKEFDKTQRSFKGIRGEKGQEKVISKDVLLNLHKPKIPRVRNRDLKRIDDVKGFVLHQIKIYFQYLAPDAPPSERTIDAITRAVQRRVLEQGCSMQGFSVGFVADVLHEAQRRFSLAEVRGAWYPSNGGINELIVRDEESAILWLTKILSKEPKRLDEIDPLWKQERLRGGYKGNRGLQELLTDFFMLNDDGTYRVPDDHERQKLKGQEDERGLREIERYVSGKMNREPTVEEKFSWIELLTEKKMWKDILTIEKTLAASPNWQELPSGKDTINRIRLARAMSISKTGKEKGPGEQRSLF
ncbi:MAG: DNA methyltransferase [Candidatus Hodarchaeota archaeon]